MNRTGLPSSFHLLLTLPLFLFGLADCSRDVPVLPDMVPPPPPPTVTADSATLYQLGKSIEGWIKAEDFSSLAPLFDIMTFAERVSYPDSLDRAGRKNVESILDDPKEYKEMTEGFWDGFTEPVRRGAAPTFLGVLRKERGAALLFRTLLAEGEVDYTELLISESSKGSLAVADAVSYLSGEFTTRAAWLMSKADKRSGFQKLLNINDGAGNTADAINESIRLYQLGKYEDALGVLKEVPHPYQQMRAVQAAMLGPERQVYGESTFQKSLNLFIERFKDGPGINLVLAELYGRQGDYSHSLEEINKLDAIVHDPYLDSWRGQVYLLMNNVDKANEHLRAVLAYDSLLVQPNFLMFFAAAQQGNYSEASGALHRLKAAKYSWPDLKEVLADPMFAKFRSSPEFRELMPIVEELSAPRQTE